MPGTASQSPGPGNTWDELRREVSRAASNEPILKERLSRLVLEQDSLGDAIAAVLHEKLWRGTPNGHHYLEMVRTAHRDDPTIVEAASRDLWAFRERDPACHRLSLPFLHYKGFHGLQLYRTGHWLWHRGRLELALHLQSQCSNIFAMDIHPAARIGAGILIDHATAIVIGETAAVGDNVSMLHEVTLGGTGKDSGDRHPKIMSGVLIGAGAKILGNVRVGINAQVGAGSVVLDDVPDHTTVAGVPARQVSATAEGEVPALAMDHTLHVSPQGGD